MIIGIAGVSRSGKSTLAEGIKKIFTHKGERAIVLSQDDFVLIEKDIPKIRNRTDWECPQSIDFQRFKKNILLNKKEYKHVITEGLLNFYDEEINTIFDKKIFVEISKETFLSRRALETRWGREPKWFIEHVWTSYLKYGLVDKNMPNLLVVSGEIPFDLEKIESFLYSF